MSTPAVALETATYGGTLPSGPCRDLNKDHDPGLDCSFPIWYDAVHKRMRCSSILSLKARSPCWASQQRQKVERQLHLPKVPCHYDLMRDVAALCVTKSYPVAGAVFRNLIRIELAVFGKPSNFV